MERWWKGSLWDSQQCLGTWFQCTFTQHQLALSAFSPPNSSTWSHSISTRKTLKSRHQAISYSASASYSSSISTSSPRSDYLIEMSWSFQDLQRQNTPYYSLFFTSATIRFAWPPFASCSFGLFASGACATCGTSCVRLFQLHFWSFIPCFTQVTKVGYTWTWDAYGFTLACSL